MDIISSYWLIFGLIGSLAFWGTRFWHKKIITPKPDQVQAQFVVTIGCFLTTLLVVCYSASIIASIISIIGGIRNLLK